MDDSRAPTKGVPSSSLSSIQNPVTTTTAPTVRTTSPIADKPTTAKRRGAATAASSSSSPSRRRRGAETTTIKPLDPSVTVKPPPPSRQPPHETKQRLVSKATPSTTPTTTAAGSATSGSTTLVLDNGGDTVKYGWAAVGAVKQEDPTPTISSPPLTPTPTAPTIRYMPNVTARLSQQWKVLVGDELFTAVSNPNACVALTRSTERGVICNLVNQIQVWKRILDVMHIAIPNRSNNSSSKSGESSAAVTFGWQASTDGSSTGRKRAKSMALPSSSGSTGSTATTPSHQCTVMIALAPFTPRTILDQILTIWLDDFGFQAVGLCVSAAAAAVYRPLRRQPATTAAAAAAAAEPRRSIVPPLNHGTDRSESMTNPEEEVVIENVKVVVDLDPSSSSSTATSDCIVPIACVVDLGWSAIHVVPVYQTKVIGTNTIRRIPFGARHLINIWKYTASYRQWNLMDNEWILRDIWEQTACLSTNFSRDMKLARSIPLGRRPFDCEYILPDYTTHNKGQVRIPPAVQEEIARQQALSEKQSGTSQQFDVEEEDIDDDDDGEDDDDDDYNETDAQNDTREGDNDIADEKNGEAVEVVEMSSSDEIEDDDEEESPEALRKRVLHERELERRRRDQEAQERQILNISVERCAIPEALFRPSDVGLPTEWANVPQAIVQAVTACPVVYRAGLYQSIQLTGGLSRLPNLVERIEQELRPLVPAQYEVFVTMLDSPSEPVVELAWKGAAKIATDVDVYRWSLSRFDWEQCSKRNAWKRLLICNGGYLL